MLISGNTTAAVTKARARPSTTHRRKLPLRWPSIDAIPVAGSLISLHQVEGSTPARLVEKVKNDVSDEANTIGDPCLLVLVFRSDKRPIDEERAAHNVGAGNESPITAVQADGAIIAHGEVLARRHDQVAILNVIGQRQGPGCCHFAAIRRRNRWE